VRTKKGNCNLNREGTLKGVELKKNGYKVEGGEKFHRELLEDEEAHFGSYSGWVLRK